MMGAALLSLLVVADGGDERFLKERVKALAATYDQLAGRQTPAAARTRAAVVRELSHLPLAGGPRESAGRLLVRILEEDRAYRVRATAARAAPRVGSVAVMRALYRALFGEAGRSSRFELMHEVLPEALESLRAPDGIDWIGRAILSPVAEGRRSAVVVAAGPLRDRLLALTLEGLGRARIRLLAGEVTKLASYSVLDVRVSAIRALAQLDTGDAVLAAAIKDKQVRVRIAATGFSRLQAGQVEKALSDPSPLVRRAMIRALAARPPKLGIELLLERLGLETDGACRFEIAETLNRLTGKEFGTDRVLWRTWWVANATRFGGPRQRDRTAERYFFSVPMRTERVLFLLDVSNSMSRRDAGNYTRQGRAAEELVRTLNSLSPASAFALIAFSGTTKRWPGNDSAARRPQAALAREWFFTLRPAGPTNTYAALMEALSDPLRPDTIVLLSDGNPYRCTYKGKNYSQHEQILAEVRRRNPQRAVRIHTVALLTGARGNDKDEDPAAAAEFLRRLATENRGEFREVR